MKMKPDIVPTYSPNRDIFLVFFYSHFKKKLTKIMTCEFCSLSVQITKKTYFKAITVLLFC